MRTTEEEKEFWYYGMTRPEQCLSQLVARSSTFPFKSARNDSKEIFWLEREVMVMSTVKGHKIVDSYDAHLRPRVRDILREAKIRWLTIDVVSLGFKHDKSGHLPVVLITVDIDKVDGESAQYAVDKIHRLMIENDLPDVHAEMKTGLYSEEVTYNSGDIYPLDLALIPKMGASISVADIGLAGSIGLFLTVNGGKYAMTCQHVVMDSPEAFTPTDEVEIPILQPGMDDLEKQEAALDIEIEGTQLLCKQFEDRKLEAEAGDRPITKGEEHGDETNRDSLKELTDRKAQMAQVKLQFGVVDCVPGKTKHPVNNCLRDWALIKLSDERFPELPTNVLPPSHFTAPERTAIMKIYGEKRLFPMEVLSKPVSTVISIEEIEDILKRSGLSDHKDRESLRVVKHGRTSGFTAGSLNEIRSDCYNGSFETTELVVVNIPDLNSFSFRGDSGACVVDLNGRIIGMLHHGNVQKGHPLGEMTYVTPMAWILADVKDTLKTDDVVVPVS